MCIHGLGYMDIFPCSVSWEGLEQNTPVAMSIPSAQILVSYTILQYKEPGFLGEMADSRSRKQENY